MQKHLAIGCGMKNLDQKTEGGGGSTNPPASLRVKQYRLCICKFSSFEI